MSSKLEAQRASSLAYYHRNREKVLEKRKVKRDSDKSYLEKQRAKYHANPERYREYAKKHSRKNQLKYNYGLSPDEWSEMQERGCDICKVRDRLCVDHCHETGVVRGVLCRPCNTAVGMLKDDPALCRLAAEYLESTVKTKEITE